MSEEMSPEEVAAKEAAKRAEALRRRIEEAEKKREAVAAEEELPYLEQRAIDLERAADLEAEYGAKRVWKMDVKGWCPKERVKGATHEAATLVMVKLPLRSEGNWQRFQSEIVRYREESGTKSIPEIERLARVCMVYPHPKSDKALYDATIELAPATFTTAAALINEKAGGQAEKDRKK